MGKIIWNRFKKKEKIMDGWTIVGLIAIFGTIIGVYVWVSAHISNRNRHPSANSIVYSDTCEARRDCIENSVKHLEKKVNEHHEYNKERFEEIKELIRNQKN